MYCMDQYERAEHEREMKLIRRPECDICGQRIQAEFWFEFAGYTICPDCMDDCKVYAED